MVQRAEDADQRKEPAPRSVIGTPTLTGRSSAAGHRHHAGQALRDQIEAALRRPRPVWPCPEIDA
jgi:hypothetical protein